MEAIVGTVTFRVEQDMLDVSDSNEPDPDWKYFDTFGHLHTWFFAKDGRKAIPTIKWVQEAPATDEYPETGHYECKRCREVVDPGYRPVSIRRQIAGLRTYYINNEVVSEEEYTKALKEAQELCE